MVQKQKGKKKQTNKHKMMSFLFFQKLRETLNHVVRQICICFSICSACWCCWATGSSLFVCFFSSTVIVKNLFISLPPRPILSFPPFASLMYFLTSTDLFLNRRNINVRWGVVCIYIAGIVFLLHFSFVLFFCLILNFVRFCLSKEKSTCCLTKTVSTVRKGRHELPFFIAIDGVCVCVCVCIYIYVIFPPMPFTSVQQ